MSKATTGAGKELTPLDLRKQLKDLYQPSAKEVVIVDVPAMHFLMVDGTGDPRRSAPEKLRTVIRQPVKPLS